MWDIFPADGAVKTQDGVFPLFRRTCPHPQGEFSNNKILHLHLQTGSHKFRYNADLSACLKLSQRPTLMLLKRLMTERPYESRKCHWRKVIFFEELKSLPPILSLF